MTAATLKKYAGTAFKSAAVLALAGSLALHFLILVCFTFRWDKVTIITVIPFFIWCAAGIGLSLFGCLAWRTPIARLLLAIWVASLVLGADESRGVLHAFADRPEPSAMPVAIATTGSGGSAPAPAPDDDPSTLRVATLNCRGRPMAASEVEAFRPDIILLQECPYPQFADRMAKKLFGENGSSIADADCAIIARGTLRRTSDKIHRDWLQATLFTRDKHQIEILNVHLMHAVTNPKLWSREAWKSFYFNRKARRLQISNSVGRLLRTAGQRAQIIGGDFNAPPTDAIFRGLQPHYTDTYRRAGSGWCNTFSKSLPLLRIDQVWITPELAAKKHAAFKTKHSDHRLVVTDLVWRE